MHLSPQKEKDTMDFWLCFACPAQFCELLPGDLDSSTVFLHNLINQTFFSRHLDAEVVAIELDFFPSENMYSLHIHIQCDAILSAFTDDLEMFKLETEVVVSQTMLQCFWKVHYSEC